MLQYLVKGKVRRRLFTLLWGDGAAGSVSALSRLAGMTFSAVHRELEAMRSAGLVDRERAGTELHYRARTDHPHATLLRQLAQLPTDAVSATRADRDETVRSWLASAGAPLGAPKARAPLPPLEEVVAESLSLAHRDAAVARVLPLVLWRLRAQMDLDRLVLEATRRDERHALGYFLELAGTLGGDDRLVRFARPLADKRRTKKRWFFAGPHGRHALAAARRNTPPQARRWGYLMNMGVDSFKSTFDKFAGSE